MSLDRRLCGHTTVVVQVRGGDGVQIRVLVLDGMDQFVDQERLDRLVGLVVEYEQRRGVRIVKAGDLFQIEGLERVPQIHITGNETQEPVGLGDQLCSPLRKLLIDFELQIPLELRPRAPFDADRLSKFHS